MALEGIIRGDVEKDVDQISRLGNYYEACDDEDEASLEVDRVSKESRVYDFHVIYSFSYHAPVMWFRGKTLGELCY